ncbi:hypothetical protein [Pseudomonas sp. TE3610]
MKTTITLSLACLLTMPLSNLALADVGTDTAKAMTAYYNDTRQACGEAPAFKCSGIMLRATKPSDKYFTWDHSPGTLEKNAASFSYLRADARFDRLAESGRSGYTLFPEHHKPAGSLDYHTLCAFPTDGDSWKRSNGGCGDNQRTPEVKERLCDKAGIQTAEQWIDHYRASKDPLVLDRWEGNPDYRFASQCSFDVRDRHGAVAADRFYQSLRVMQLMNDRPFPWNEVMIQAWDQSKFPDLPIQSFFHIEGMGGLGDAQKVQKQWHDKTGKFIPVIGIRLPAGSQPAQFTYRADHQHKGVPN